MCLPLAGTILHTANHYLPIRPLGPHRCLARHTLAPMRPQCVSPSPPPLVFGRHTTPVADKTQTGVYYVTRNMNKAGDVQGEVFFSKDEASAHAGALAKEDLEQSVLTEVVMPFYTRPAACGKRNGLFVPLSNDCPAPAGFPLRMDTFRAQHGNIPSALFLTHSTKDILSLFDGGAELITSTVKIENARALLPMPTLSTHGFELLWCPSASAADLTGIAGAKRVQEDYYGETESALRELTGADAAIAITHVLRTSDDAKKCRDAGAGFATYMHTDQSHRSWAPRLAEVLCDSWIDVGPPGLSEADARRASRARRYVVLSAWRYLGPAETCRHSHLALLDHTTLTSRDEVLDFSLIAGDFEGGNYRLRESSTSAHRFLYYPAMSRDEMLCFTVFDSNPPVGTSDSLFKHVPVASVFHGAFKDPTAPKGEPQRESVDVRVLLIWD